MASECEFSMHNYVFQVFINCGFRLKYNAKGVITQNGLCEPHAADVAELEIWQPKLPVLDPPLDVNMSKYVLQTVSDRFCELVEQEKEAMSWFPPNSEYYIMIHYNR